MKANAVCFQCRAREEMNTAREIALVLQTRWKTTPADGLIAGTGRRQIEVLSDRIALPNGRHVLGEPHSNRCVVHLLSREQDGHSWNGAVDDFESQAVAAADSRAASRAVRLVAPERRENHERE